ncbi:MAG: MBL fold metallo-hydrolase [Gemmatimonadota bacterium]
MTRTGSYARWFRRRGVTRVVEMDWWDAAALPGGAFHATTVPARHWTRRAPLGTNKRLWCGWVVKADALSLYFAGDSGYCSVFSEIGARLGPFQASLLPIGAYEPRWFMAAAHMNPEEAVQAYRDLGAAGAMVGMHWGTWRLTFEDPLEPPERTRTAWEAAGLPRDRLLLPAQGETIRLTPR